MDNETLKALQDSIAKWKDIVNSDGIERGSCTLCKLFLKKDCVGCPVMQSSGSPFCYNTPYYEHNDDADLETRIRTAQIELDFLMSLLPKDAI